MSKKPPAAVNAVLRIPDVRVTREQLEAAFGVAVARYGPLRKGPGLYAQVNFPEVADWEVQIELMRSLGPAIAAAVARGDIGRPNLDFALFAPMQTGYGVLRIPSRMIEAMSAYGVDLEVSAHFCSDEEDEKPGGN